MRTVANRLLAVGINSPSILGFTLLGGETPHHGGIRTPSGVKSCQVITYLGHCVNLIVSSNLVLGRVTYSDFDVTEKSLKAEKFGFMRNCLSG
jgi:hypothetical protein